ncbi:probable trehalose-phosphate phosphatase 2 isoform X2 [Hermetia illucens]|nr:probable trehalose-phosphate phosphatase 2 isoform X2 [Hermetia illucens]
MPQQIVRTTLANAEDFRSNLNGYLTPNSKLALFLDYDGTLAAIADHPDFTKMSEETESTLRRLTKNPNIFVAVISGRGLGDIKSKVRLENITYGGNHGYEIQNADGSRSDFQLPQEVKDNYSKMVAEMTKRFSIEGAWVEDKKVSLTFHYRDAAANITPELLRNVTKTIESYGFRANQAISAIEAKPPINWNKGEAALLLLRKNFGEDWKHAIKTIAVGDDTTDEDLMKICKGVGKSFRVSTDGEIQTNAEFRLPSTKEVTLLLKWIEEQYN